jgi:hypothetical protein
MSKDETDFPERLRAAGATNLERRLIDAAGGERPSRELSERMARSIGVTFAVTEIAGSVKTGTSVGTATKASSSLVSWLSGAVVATGIAIGVYVATRPAAKPVTLPPAAPALSASAAVAVPASKGPAISDTPATDAPRVSDEDSLPKAAVAGRGRRGTVAGELANQIAIVDAARSALAAGNAQRALSLARQYQSEYANGAFGPEVAAVKIEALVKLGRMAEARTLAERFVVAFGPGPLAERVARLALIGKP